MGSSSVSWWREALVLLIPCVLQPMLPVSRGCFAEERAALMEIHTSLIRANSTLPLPSWAAHEDCCSWERVRCSSATRRVSHLDLSFLNDPYPNPGVWSLDTTIFAAFPELQFLDLSWNRPVQLSLDGFKKLSNLRALNLSFNHVSGELSSFIFSLPHIEVLHLLDNMIEGPFIPIRSSSSSTHTPLSFDGFKNLTNLRELDLSYNKINGTLPSFLFSLPHIQLLDLSNNMVEGPIPVIIPLSLRRLRLSHNNLRGRFSFFSLKNLSNLVEISLSANANLGVDVNIPGWVPRFQLKQLLLSSCDLDKDIIAKPAFLGTQHNLEYLDLSNNNLSGAMPNWLLTKGSTLVSLNLGNNSLAGALDPIWYPHKSLQYIDLSMNHIVGQLPTNISSVFPSLIKLHISNNNFSGEIPTSLCDINKIETIDLSNNNFFGKMPACVFTNLPDLLYLIASNNQLGGPIFSGRSNLSDEIIALNLDGNKFEGVLPRNLSGNLLILDLHDNRLTGELDTSSWKLPSLKVLHVAGNYLTGEIRPQIYALPSIKFLDLSNNRFTGRNMWSCNSPFLMSLNMSMNSLSGDVSWENFNTSNLIHMDVSHNMLTGNLSWLHRLPMMKVLSLSHNKFHGQIPLSLCELRHLMIIDLSYNKLSGPVPPCIGDIPFQEPSQFVVYELEVNNMDDINTLTVNGGFSFTTKVIQLTYGPTAARMSGIDLSGNLLSGEIPWELGELSLLKSLNLSCNVLTGPIPASLANMSDVESLDLSHNNLTGAIPPELTRLSSLEVFSVAYNRLSGCVPSTGQFGSFLANTITYEGNDQLKMNCSSSPPGLDPEPIPPRNEMVVDTGTYVAGAASFVLAFWATIAFTFCHPTR